MIKLFHQVSQECSRITTELYSTSFSSSIRLLHKDLRTPVFNIYGFVRFADEIVDTFHDFDKETLLAEFKAETYKAIDQKISLNPILHSFQLTVNEFKIDRQLIDAFLHSMEMDLGKKQYDKSGYEEYIYGSAEVVGLMCLYVFCNGDQSSYEHLKPYACSLGSAFQKVNFLRDLKADFEGLDRMYFPGCDFSNFTQADKLKIEEDIQRDFDHAYEGILQLPLKARFGVYVAYKYYLSLFKKIKKLQPQKILDTRVRIPDHGKMFILAKAGIRSQLNLL
ncbi:MAG: phytoene synthase [Sphingobacteriia bacterium 24-36-13]|jgi:phytoene/squalene synthetase|uniref:phytoene/squalene synthase family protein n=1 Tax=Sediminibacterium sp. TaxID=1917865 RepID=UPI000BCFE9E4|nr:phytoene/squalene synthase family protein [Sediminibacterium sp.]OYY08639.1 MAG: phytoene synthase [Sphingobacteriia bacterium 35-36-14]OYZ51535.1 MAG: phytoene synthase [Sphingobacteriia bacterium 24-36-13]OZA63379.1 MAG: phytoene synthase [Sphingobacteriia bacterium 39-36-14]HQS25544.1 phytoene/squalene synthase family protein [Sediminibacterium sp.]HQS35965.1 phytoene/squalene synthase family protein [Sediminibacterium sp.]